VIEGVETERQAAVLTELGCRFMQGYYFGKPAAFHAIALAA
jgi:EAL domain-containing protein (putative c-di-GMP-specific phosphodiesterase class I)